MQGVLKNIKKKMVLKRDLSTVNLSLMEIYQTIELSMSLFSVFEKMDDPEPVIGVRRLAYRVGVSLFVVRRALNVQEQALHLYHVQRVQQ